MSATISHISSEEAEDGGERGPVLFVFFGVYKITFVAFFVYWCDKSCGPSLWEFAGGV